MGLAKSRYVGGWESLPLFFSDSLHSDVYISFSREIARIVTAGREEGNKKEKKRKEKKRKLTENANL
jgi:hypothetical protein